MASIAEGAGELSPKEKARVYRMARRSGDRGRSLARDHGPTQRQLEQVVAMLVVLIKSCDR